MFLRNVGSYKSHTADAILQGIHQATDHNGQNNVYVVDFTKIIKQNIVAS
jgi:hypothetical protein